MADLALAIQISGVDEASPALAKAAGSIGAVESAATKAGGAIGGFGLQLGNIAQMAVGFAVGGALIGFLSSIPEKITGIVTSTTDLGQATFKLQSIIGGTMEQTSALLAVFERYGVPVDQASTSLGIFSRHLAGIADTTMGIVPGSKTFTQSMRELGVAFVDANNQALPMNDVLLSVADKFATLGPGADRTAIAMQLFGRSGKDMLPVLALGAAGMQEAEDAATKYGLTLTGANVQAIRDYGFAEKDLSEATTGVSLSLGMMLLPALTSVATAVAFDAQTMNQTIIPAMKNLGQSSAEQADVFALAMDRIHKAQAGFGSNASDSPAMLSAADQTVQNMVDAGNTALGYIGILGRLGTADGVVELATRGLGVALAATAPPVQHLGDTMGEVAANAGTVGTTTAQITPPVQHLGDTIGAVSANTDEMNRNFIASVGAMDTARAAATQLSITFTGIHPGNELTNFTGEGPSSNVAKLTTNTKDLTLAANQAEAAANAAGKGIGTIGTSALAALPGLSALDMAIAGTSQKLAAVQLQIEDKVLARMEARPATTVYQQEALLQEQLKVENLQKAAGFTVGTEAIKISNADIRAGKHPGGAVAPAGAAGQGITVTFHPGAVQVNPASADKLGTDLAAFIKSLNSGGPSAGPARTHLSGLKN